MKTAAVLLALAMTSATVGELRIVPPPKYDHPYAGNLAIWPVKTQQQVQAAPQPQQAQLALGADRSHRGARIRQP